MGMLDGLTQRVMKNSFLSHSAHQKAMFYIQPQNISVSLKAENEKALIKMLSQKIAKTLNLPLKPIEEDFIKHKILKSSSIGDGIILGHLKGPNVDDLTVFFFHLKKPVPCDTIDGNPIDLLYLIMSPKDKTSTHLKIMAETSRFFKNNDNKKRLKGCDSKESIIAFSDEANREN